DLEQVVVGIVEVDALLAGVVDRLVDRYARVLEREIGALQIFLRRDGERRVLDAETVARPTEIRLLPRKCVRVGAGKKIERIAVVSQCEEYPAVAIRIAFEHLESQDFGIELKRAFEIAHRKQDVADALQLDHVHLPRRWIPEDRHAWNSGYQLTYPRQPKGPKRPV